MFAIGSTTTTVTNEKVMLPSTYHLKRKSILAKWKDKNTLFLSDSDKSLNYAAGKDAVIFTVNVDAEDRINVPKAYNNSSVEVIGCISTIELIFRR